MFTSVTAGYDHTCALTDDNRIRCRGSDLFGQSTPPSSGRKYVSVTAGPQHTCAIQRGHSQICWGGSERTRPVGSDEVGRRVGGATDLTGPPGSKRWSPEGGLRG